MYSVHDQLSSKCLKRELNKAFCGFCRDAQEQRSTVATGNWGCGAFGGDPAVKFLIQLMAASQAERPLFYFTFDNFQFGRDIYEVILLCCCMESTFLMFLVGYHGLVALELFEPLNS